MPSFPRLIHVRSVGTRKFTLKIHFGFVCLASLLLITLSFTKSNDPVCSLISIAGAQQDSAKSLMGSPPTSVEFELKQRDTVSITVFTVKGRLVKQIFKGVLEEGKHKFVVVTQEMASGVYYVVVKAHTEILKKRILVLK